MEALKVGHGRECITPPLGIKMVGYAARTEGARDVHDDLFVNAVALQAGQEQIALLAYDVCSFRLELVTQIKSAIAERTGLGPERVLLNTSHTHAGPLVGRRHDEEGHPEYTRSVVQKSVEALSAALEDAVPATFRVGSAPVDIGCNRRERQPDGSIRLGHNPDGPSLKEMTVWRFARSQKPDVVLFSTAMHGTTLGGKNLSISAEWMGRAVHRLETESADIRAVFLQGCAGDQDPYYTLCENRRGTFDEVEQHGRDAAAAVTLALDEQRELNPFPLCVLSREVTLPGKEDESDTRSLPMHGLRMGDAVLLGLGCEAFVEYALFGREVCPAEETLVLGYTDAGIGYLCTADAFEDGGYETNTSRVAPQSEQMVKDAMVEMLSDLAG